MAFLAPIVAILVKSPPKTQLFKADDARTDLTTISRDHKSPLRIRISSEKKLSLKSGE